MARRKETIWQQDFSLGAVRKEAIERDDVQLVGSSFQEGENTLNLTTGQIEGRSGTVYCNTVTGSEGYDVDLGDGRSYDMHINPSGLKLFDASGATVVDFPAHDWTSLPQKYGTYNFEDIVFWVVTDPDSSSVIIGSSRFPIQALTVDAGGVWSLGQMALAQSAAGAIGQPYWRYNSGVKIQPSARTGAITVTADAGIWTDAHDGTSIRYVDREVRLGSRVSSTVINATVIEELPATWNITVASVSGYQLGDAVEHGSLGGQGVITGISGTVITVLTTSSFDGFDATDKLVGPNASQAISAAVLTSPANSDLWDAQMMSPVFGYPGDGTIHPGRFVLSNFPGAPRAYAVGVAGSVVDFRMGAEDADGFVEAIGSGGGGDLLYTVSAEDLLFFTTRGVYYHSTRSGEAITPSTINPVRFSRVGCKAVRPVAVDDGAIFVDAVGGKVMAAVLSGDVYKSWRTINLTKFSSDHVPSPVHIGATQSGSEKAEDFVYVTNSDGRVGVCQWDRDDDTISWRPWSTSGSFLSIYQALGSIHAIVERAVDGSTVRFRECFRDNAVMDCSVILPVADADDETSGAFAPHLVGAVASVYFERWDMGDATVAASGYPLDSLGQPLDYPSYDGDVQIGFPFTVHILPWPRRSVQTQRGTREVKKLIGLFVSCQDSAEFMVGTRSVGGYRSSEPFDVPPPLRSEQYKIGLLGAGAYGVPAIVKDRPGPIRITKIGYRVTV